MFRSVLVTNPTGRQARRRTAAPIFGVCVFALGVAGSSAPASGQMARDSSVRRVVEAYHAGRLEEATQLVDSVRSSLPAGDAAVLSFYRGLLQFAAGDESGARAMFLRAVELDPRLTPDPALHSPSRLRVFEAARDWVVSQWRSAADRAETAGDLLMAQRHWQNVLLALPDDSAAVSGLAGVHLALAGVERAADARNIPVTDSTASGIADPGSGRPGAAGDTAGGGEDDAASAGGEAAMGPYSPERAALLGVVPGLGEVYADRPFRGALIMGAAAGAVAFGVMTEKVDVRCLSVPAGGICPPEDVAGEEVTRPYLTPSLGVAAALTVLGAVDAYFAARRANARAAPQAGNGAAAERGARLERPALVPTSRTLRLELLRIRF